MALMSFPKFPRTFLAGLALCAEVSVCAVAEGTVRWLAKSSRVTAM